jgi:hypothetical protein
MFRHRTCAILRELKVPDETCLRQVMGAKDSESGCWYRMSSQLKIPLPRTARNHHILHMPMEWMNEINHCLMMMIKALSHMLAFWTAVWNREFFVSCRHHNCAVCGHTGYWWLYWSNNRMAWYHKDHNLISQCNENLTSHTYWWLYWSNYHMAWYHKDHNLIIRCNQNLASHTYSFC